MKLLSTQFKTRNLLLPLIMVVAVFFISQGIDLPNFSSALESQLAAPKVTKSSDSLLKTSTKSQQVKIAKTIGSFAVLSEGLRVSRVAFTVACFTPHHPHLVSAVISVSSARAPPA